MASHAIAAAAASRVKENNTMFVEIAQSILVVGHIGTYLKKLKFTLNVRAPFLHFKNCTNYFHMILLQ